MATKAKAREWWRVSGPYVTVKTSTTEGMRIIGLHRGAPLPLDVTPDAIEHLASHGLIESFPLGPAEEEHLAEDPPGGPGAPPPPDEPPAGVLDPDAGGQAPTQPAGEGSSPAGKGGGSSARSGSGSGTRTASK